ncbi:arylsulfatase [Nitrosococcus watsonii]|uniref:Sulfatase n=1 Tax=Nitrosococcus watsoni (strain C-113) TaxID=105559 RepID=D8K486_NITWC|nr:arylsulfatase [Nitrosococcus watsonii]ADJ27783.1 sulfatase [Nitrosococcus watsonii C-113]
MKLSPIKFIALSASCMIALHSAGAVAQEGRPGVTAPQLNLPYAEQKYRGNVGTTYLNSDAPQFPKQVAAPEGAPNVLLVLLDDVGFGQFSVAGGGVPSPSMEALAEEGVFFNRFHTTAVCSSTRAALLTGRNHHVAGTGNITEVATGYDGYTGVIPKDTATFAEILRMNGYITSWIGKNHNTPTYETSAMGPFDHWPNNLGFDYFYGFMAGDTSQIRPYLYENQTPVGQQTDDDYYLSVDLADHSIQWLQQTEAIQPDKPWMMYLAPAATHSPHQAPKEMIAKFKGKFDGGWDEYRKETLARQIRMGVVPKGTKLTKRHDSLPAWDSLSPDEKKLSARMMEVFAAYGEHVDQQVGRVLDYVKTLPDADNTLIIYIIGDNGASSEGGIPGTLNENAFFNGVQMQTEDMMPFIDEIGTSKHFNHFPAAWAHAMDTPFQWVKQVASHLGGTRNAMLVSWPAKYDNGGEVRSQFTHVIDVAATILDAAGIEEPRSVNGTAQKPIEGRSFLSVLADKDAAEIRTSQYFEMFVNRGIYKDGWWAGALSFTPWNPNRGAFDPLSAPWELYHLEEDFSQANNLAKEKPKKLDEMVKLWWATASKEQVLPLDWRGSERFSAELMGKPNLAAGRSEYIYPVPIVGLPEASAPDLKNKSFTITAKITIDDNANGMIFTQGGNTGGWGFYLLNGKLVATHNYLDIARYTVASDKLIAAGEHVVKMEFDYKGKDKEVGKGGTITLFVDGQRVGKGNVEKTAPMKYSLSENQDIGTDTGTPVTYDYREPFDFQGTLGEVVVSLK